MTRYLRIVKHLKTEEYGIVCMKKMLLKLEKEEDPLAPGPDRKNRSASHKKRTDPPARASSRDSAGLGTDRRPQRLPADMHLDVVPDSMKARRLQEAIKTCTDKVFESKAITPWRHIGNKDTMENAVHKDFLQRPDKPAKKKPDSDDEEEGLEPQEPEDAKPRTLPKVPLDPHKKTTWEKKYGELAKFPFMRGKDNEDDASQEGLPEDRPARGGKPAAKNEDFGGGFGDEDFGGFDADL